MLNLNLWFIVPKNVSKPLLPHPLGQSPSFDQFEFWPLRRWRPARVMPFYLGALRTLNIATRYSKNTLSCSELSEEHAGEGFRSLRHTLTPLWACKAKTCHFPRKFDVWPDLTRWNINLGPKTICAIARSRRGASTGFFREALRPSGADRQGGGSHQPPPPLHGRRWQNTEYGRGLTSSRESTKVIFMWGQNWGHQRSSRTKFSQISELHDVASYYAHYLGPCNSYIKI